METNKLRRDALAIYQAALKAANARDAVRLRFNKGEGYLSAGKVKYPLRNTERVFVLAVGKAACDMATAVEHRLGKKIAGGMIVTKHGHAASYSGALKVWEAGHPIPDENGAAAAGAVREMLQGLDKRDLLIVAVSGGASALLCAPVERIQLADKQATTDLLLKAGADIFELNCVRKHLSMLKGGNLAALAYPARVMSLILSDVVGDPIDVIGSGLTAPDPTTYGDAIAVLKKRGIFESVPKPVIRHLQSSTAETPKPGDDVFKHVTNVVIGSNRLALEAAALEAKRRGYRTLILSSRIQGEARVAAQFHADILLETLASCHPLHPPACILSGGETTVTVRGQGKGGRNQEFALAAAMAIKGTDKAVVLAAGTDGSDGPTDAAGALVAGDTLEQAESFGMNAGEFLERNDSYHFFDKLGALIKTGPTGTNVMDVNIMLAG